MSRLADKAENAKGVPAKLLRNYFASNEMDFALQP